MSWCLTGVKTFAFLIRSSPDQSQWLHTHSQTGRIFSHLATGSDWRSAAVMADLLERSCICTQNLHSCRVTTWFMITSLRRLRGQPFFLPCWMIIRPRISEQITGKWEIFSASKLREFHFLELRLAQSWPLNLRTFSAAAAGNLQAGLL